ncbi:MAG: hypothetical protein PVH56_06585, partial [Desulfobacterales bacterium]
EYIRERYIKQHQAVAIDHNYLIILTALLISRPCLLLRSLMCEFHTFAKRVIFKTGVTYLSFRDNRIKNFRKAGDYDRPQTR